MNRVIQTFIILVLFFVVVTYTCNADYKIITYPYYFQNSIIMDSAEVEVGGFKYRFSNDQIVTFDSTEPDSGEVYVYDAGAHQFYPTTISSSGGSGAVDSVNGQDGTVEIGIDSVLQYGANSTREVTFGQVTADVFVGVTAGMVKINDTIGTPVSNDSLNDYLRHTASTGYFFGGNFIDNGDGSLTVIGGSGIIRTENTIEIDWNFIVWDTDDSVSLADDDVNYIYVDETGSIEATTTKKTDYRQYIPLGKVFRDGTTLYTFNAGRPNNEPTSMIQQRFTQQFGEITRTSGLLLSDGGSQCITISSGVVWGGFTKKTIAAIDTSGTDRFTAVYGDTSNGFTFMAGQDQVDITNYYDGAGSMQSISNNRYSERWVYRSFDGSATYVMFGESNILNPAKVELTQPPSDLPSVISEFCVFVGKIIIREGVAAFVEVSSPFDTIFTPSLAADHGNLSGLDDPSDHPWAALVDGTRDITGNQTILGDVTADNYNGNVSSATSDDTDWDNNLSGVSNDIDSVLDAIDDLPIPDKNIFIGDSAEALLQVDSNEIFVYADDSDTPEIKFMAIRKPNTGVVTFWERFTTIPAVIYYFFNSSTEDDYIISGTKEVTWNSDATSIYNSDEKTDSNLSDVTFEVELAALKDTVDIEEIVVNYGSEDKSNEETTEVSLIDCTQASDTDFLDWTVKTGSWNRTVSTAYATSNNSVINYAIPTGYDTYTMDFTFEGTTENIVMFIGFSTDTTSLSSSSNLKWGIKNIATRFYVLHNASNANLSIDNTDGTWYCRLKIDKVSSEHYTGSCWLNQTGDFSGTPDYTNSNEDYNTDTFYAGVQLYANQNPIEDLTVKNLVPGGTPCKFALKDADGDIYAYDGGWSKMTTFTYDDYSLLSDINENLSTLPDSFTATGICGFLSEDQLDVINEFIIKQ